MDPYLWGDITFTFLHQITFKVIFAAMAMPIGEAQFLFEPHAQKNPLFVCKFFWNPGVQIFLKSFYVRWPT
jgi:hypothetical protein